MKTNKRNTETYLKNTETNRTHKHDNNKKNKKGHTTT